MTSDDRRIIGRAIEREGKPSDATIHRVDDLYLKALAFYDVATV